LIFFVADFFQLSLIVCKKDAFSLKWPSNVQKTEKLCINEEKSLV